MNTFNEKFPGAGGTGSGMEPAKGGFWRNLGMIRPVAWTIAIILLVGLTCVMWFVALPSDKAEMARTPLVLQMLLAILPGAFLFVYVLLVGFVHVDAKRRGMRYIMWTLLAIFIGNFIGIILYFIMRDPMPTPCPKCGFMAKSSFSFCPRCSTELFRACKVCHKKLDPGWVNCAYCGSPIGNQPSVG